MLGQVTVFSYYQVQTNSNSKTVQLQNMPHKYFSNLNYDTCYKKHKLPTTVIYLRATFYEKQNLSE